MRLAYSRLRDLSMHDATAQLSAWLTSGRLALIAAGFRCNTRMELGTRLGIVQETLPFDNGFFPPAAIARLLRADRLDLREHHLPCQKISHFLHEDLGVGIRFLPSTYDRIDQQVTGADMPDINRYLDSTFGYYTLDTNGNYVLAHYNWHRLAENGVDCVHNVQANVAAIETLLTRRLQRLRQKCSDAEIVLLVYGELRGLQYMMVGDDMFSLTDLSPMRVAADEVFGSKSRVITLDEVRTPEAVLELLHSFPGS